MARRAGPWRQRLVVMARVPHAGAVKTRLAREVGAVEAVRFARVNLVRTIRAVGRDPRWATMLALTPDGAPSAVGALARIPQGAGGLGERMARIFASLPPGPAVIVGGDVPGITPAHIARAFRLLGRHDAVFGPAGDGGYWLVGLRRFPRTPRIFEDVRWSTSCALADTLANCGGLGTALADTLADVDDARGWRRWRSRWG